MSAREGGQQMSAREGGQQVSEAPAREASK
jgi:hypothetical protein